jgi:hypothetical protein
MMDLAMAVLHSHLGAANQASDLRYHFIRDVVHLKQVELFFIEGAENPTDMFTKNLGCIKFLKFREQLGLLIHLILLSTWPCTK